MIVDSFVKLLGGVSTVLWPLIVIAILFFFRAPVSELIQSAKSRKFTIKIGGQELTMEEASEQQRSLISDLQAQIAEIRRSIGESPHVEGKAFPKPVGDQVREIPSILWVDDQPKHNSYFIAELQDLGIRVDTALSTSEGLSLLAARRYGAIVSDMGRKEQDKFNLRAGFDLLIAVRERAPKIPFIIFTGVKSAQEYREEAIRLGASGITSSPTELYALLNLEQLRKGV
jgi:CheY-like chemotaxis protein